MIHLYYCLESLSLKVNKQKQPFRKTYSKKLSFFIYIEKKSIDKKSANDLICSSILLVTLQNSVIVAGTTAIKSKGF